MTAYGPLSILEELDAPESVKFSEENNGVHDVPTWRIGDKWVYETQFDVAQLIQQANVSASLNTLTGDTTMEVVDGTEEQVLSGYEINISSQIPYMPWATFNWQNYGWEKDEATNNTEGNMLSLETMLSPTV